MKRELSGMRPLRLDHRRKITIAKPIRDRPLDATAALAKTALPLQHEERHRLPRQREFECGTPVGNINR
jgi:hypothetical protein